MASEYIIMGDVIGSSKQDAVGLMENVQEVIRSANREFKEDLRSPLTVTLGDEFQGVASSLDKAVRILFYLDETRLRKEWMFSFRYVIHYGEIDTDINTEVAYGMLGEGLTKARSLLELKEKGKRFRILVEDEQKSRMLNRLLFAADGISKRWSRKNMPLIYDMIFRTDNAEVAGKHEKNASQIWKMRRNNLIEEYRQLKEVILEVANS